ncbi:MAG: aldo/keto reductase, partial [Spirochaeta sp.]
DGMEATRPLIQSLQEIARQHDASIAQIAIAWIFQRHGTGMVTIPGASTASQAASNAAAMKISLSARQIEYLDRQGREAEIRLKGKKAS